MFATANDTIKRRGLPASLVFWFQFGLVIIALATILAVQTEFNINEKSVFFAIESDVVSHMVLGFNNLAADLIWLRLIQDIDHKEGQHVSRGWVFQLLDNITTLDPRYRIAYATGTAVLTVLIQDTAGATVIYDRALKQFPNDWILQYQAGYHYLYELKDCKRAAEILELAAQNGAPGWVHALAGRLYSRTGQYELGRSILMANMEKYRDNPGVYKHFQEKLEALNKEASSGGEIVKGVDCGQPTAQKDGK